MEGVVRRWEERGKEICCNARQVAVVEEEGGGLLRGHHAFRERLETAWLSEALRSRAWPACGGIPGCTQPEEGSSTGRPAGCSAPGERWEGSCCQLLVCAEQSRTRRSPATWSHLWVSHPWWENQHGQLLLFSLLRLLSPQRREGYFPQAGTNITVPKVQKFLRSWGSTTRPAFLSLCTLQSQVCLQQPFCIWHGGPALGSSA